MMVDPLPWPASLDEEHRRLYSHARRIAREELIELPEAGEEGRVNRPLLAALAHHGLLPALFPSKYGGTQPERVFAVDLCILREAVAAESPEAETALAMQGLGAYPILESGTSEDAGRWIPEVAAGRAVAAFALTEPGAGSDAAALSTRAERDGAGYRLTGTKVWISNAPEADIYTVFARTSGETGARGVTAFAVPGDSPGLSGEHADLLAPHAIGSLMLDGVYTESVLGEVDHGFRVAMQTLSRFRPSVGAFSVGMAQAALEATLRHVEERHAFGGPLRSLQAVSHRLAQMALEVHTARVTVYDAALAFDRGENGLVFRSSAAKLYATEAGQRVVDSAIQLHGALALRKGHLLERLYREVRAPRIYEGASDIQLEVIARELAK